MQIFCMCPDRRGLGHDNCSLVRLGNSEHVVEHALSLYVNHIKPVDFILVRLTPLCDV